MERAGLEYAAHLHSPRHMKAATLLAVQVADPDQADNTEPKKSCSVVIEAQTTRITITGLIDAGVVRTVLECLAR